MGGYQDPTTGIFRKVGDIHGISLAQAKAIRFTSDDDGKVVQLSDGNFYVYRAASVLTGDDALVITPTESVGRLLLAPGYNFDLAIAFTYAKADAAAHLTSPNTGFLAMLGRSYWEITANFTGGSSSAIGASLGAAPHSTKGDVLGGAGGDVAATLVASGGKLLGTIGADVAGGILWKGNVALRHDRIVDAYTAGTGYLHAVGRMLANPAA
jgi:hypothetical protein